MLNFGSSPEPVFGPDRQLLTRWIESMEGYGQSWFDDIGKDYFSQEYWYLFTITLVYHWRQTPLSVSEACDSMKTGSSKTRENRLKKLITEHFFIKIKNQTDLRRTYLEPTTEMLLGGRKHFSNSLGRAIQFLDDARLLASNPQPLLDGVLSDGEHVDKNYLLPWAEFLIGYTNDWNNTFSKRFHTEEYWYPFTYCLLACWRGQRLTTSEVCQCMRTGSGRTKEKRVSLAVSRGMLVKQKSNCDLRTTYILTSSVLEELLISHFGRTLNNLLSLTQGLLARQQEIRA
ncbi:MAG: hypothetical protein OXF58_01365 [Gammaproteobacteria bacterium]|nr:hypothetical protein [Gammaproteobacteria bacterium]